ncbi:MAG: ATP-binding protein, partial [Melioribacteraceae bacterium]|nr:ATP-binding protein [Melioribacteraceae bacterium]
SAKKIKVSFSEKRDSDRLVSGDYVLIELVISNLLNNAIKYGKNGGRVIIESSEEKGAYFLSIMDDGIGIPKDDQSKIFKQFFRSKSGSSYGVEGTGLGLSVVKEILDRLGGEIDFESPSRIGDDQFPGTEFKIRLNFGDETLIPHKDDKVFMGREI